MTSCNQRTLAALLGQDVAVATETNPAAAEPLFASEEAAVRDAVSARRTEFAVGRTCARRALGKPGAPGSPICVGEMREPLWPRGFVGSITHCGSFWAAAVARSSELSGLGIDAALNQPLEPAVRDLIVACDAEAALAGRTDFGVFWDIVLFSAKEAIFKTWWPARRQWLDFADVHVALNQAAGTFTADIGPAARGSARTVSGQFAVVGDLVLAAAVLVAD